MNNSIDSPTPKIGCCHETHFLLSQIQMLYVYSIDLHITYTYSYNKKTYLAYTTRYSGFFVTLYILYARYMHSAILYIIQNVSAYFYNGHIVFITLKYFKVNYSRAQNTSNICILYIL